MKRATMMNPNPQRLDSADGLRRATGRTVKGESADRPGTYVPVEVWTLKERRDARGHRSATGKLVVVSNWQHTRAEAEAWVAGEVPRNPDTLFYLDRDGAHRALLQCERCGGWCEPVIEVPRFCYECNREAEAERKD